MNIKKSFNNRHFKSGSYAAIVTVIALAIVIFVNLVIGQLPSTVTNIDFTANELYSITDETKTILSGLESEVTIYLIAQSGNEDTDIQQILDRYEDASSKIKVETKDPALYPNFTTQYTTDTLAENSVIVVCGDRYKVIAYDEIFETAVDYTTYAYTYSFDAEGEITSAIDYVTSEDLPVLYTLEGHGETEFDTTTLALIEKQNYDVESLSLVSTGSIPEDIGCLIINAPTSDISADESSIIIDYLAAGGSALIFTDYTETDMPNLDSVLEYYGVAAVDGIVFEGSTGYYYSNYPHYVVPSYGTSDITASLLSDNMYTLLTIAQGIEQLADVRSTVTITPLLSTSDSAYSKIDGYNIETMEKEDGDIEGPFDLGVAISEEVDDEETRLVWYTSSAVTNSDVDSVVSGGNSELLINSINYLCEQDEKVVIDAKSYAADTLTLTSAQSNRWAVITIIVLPIATIALGIIVCVGRRKR